jgi:hypothetical protein
LREGLQLIADHSSGGRNALELTPDTSVSCPWRGRSGYHERGVTFAALKKPSSRAATAAGHRNSHSHTTSNHHATTAQLHSPKRERRPCDNSSRICGSSRAGGSASCRCSQEAARVAARGDGREGSACARAGCLGQEDSFHWSGSKRDFRPVEQDNPRASRRSIHRIHYPRQSDSRLQKYRLTAKGRLRLSGVSKAGSSNKRPQQQQ